MEFIRITVRAALLMLVALAFLHPQAAALSPSTVSLQSGPNPSTFGQAVTLTATVSPSSASGKVTFYCGTEVLGVSTISSGQATFTTSLLPAGVGSLKAYYAGDSNDSASTSVAISQSVIVLPQNGFRSAVNYNAGSGATSVAVGDFNGDGKADLAVPNFNTNTVSILIGNGDGTFQAAVNYIVAANPSANPVSVAVGDFNGDGKADLAVANDGDASISILLGNGNGTFQPAVSYSAGTEPEWVAVGDFNGDGKADLVVANYGSQNLNVLLGNGDGTFRAAVNYSLFGGSLAVAIGDFNGDGKADLAVADYDNATLDVLLGNGDGTFSTPLAYPVSDILGATPGPCFVVVGDFNGDGKLDAAVSNCNSDNVSVFLGNGDGTFPLKPNYIYNVGSAPVSIAVGDFNGDGRADLVVTNYGGNLSVLLGNGDGTFQAAVAYPTGNGPSGVAVGDFSADGRTDLAVANFLDNTVSVLMGIVSNPDLSVSVAHSGNFISGQSGSYLIIVNNAGPAPTNGAVSVSVTDTLPAGLTATAMSGTGWSCTLNTLTCARSDSLDASASYPAISLTVSLTANAAAQVTNSVTASGGGSTPASASVVTTILTSGPAFSPIALNFPVGESSASQTVTMTNIGTGPLVVTNVAASGSFSQTNNCTTVPASGNCTITVTFTPGSSGASSRTGAITITDNALNSPQLIRLSGVAVFSSSIPGISLSNLSLNFGSQAINTTTAAKTVTLTNSGVGEGLTVSSVTASGNFAQTNNCGAEAPSSTCTIGVTFTPTAIGTRQGSVVIVSTVGTLVIRLSGTGSSAAAPAIGLSNVSLNFGSQATGTSSSARTITITNAGTATLTITGVASTGDFSASGCVTSLSPGATCNLNVTFTPTIAGARHGTVAIVDNAAGSPQVIQLFGNGT
jgi:uncharacterized repeat protein (TIGR01451 family)